MNSLPFEIKSVVPARVRYIVEYELGDPDRGDVRSCVAETFAVSAKQAINNIRYRVGKNPTFFPIKVKRG